MAGYRGIASTSILSISDIAAFQNRNYADPGFLDPQHDPSGGGTNLLDYFWICVIFGTISKGPFLIGGPVSFLRKYPFVKVAA